MRALWILVCALFAGGWPVAVTWEDDPTPTPVPEPDRPTAETTPLPPALACADDEMICTFGRGGVYEPHCCSKASALLSLDLDP